VEAWNSTCNNYAEPGQWGDHITLFALCEHFGVPIFLLQSAEACPILRFFPSNQKKPDAVLLSLFGQLHYNAMRYVGSKTASEALFGEDAFRKERELNSNQAC